MCGRTDIFCDIYSLYFTQKLNLVNGVSLVRMGARRGCASVIIKDIKNVKTSFFISFYMQIEIRRIIVIVLALKCIVTRADPLDST